MTFSSLLDPHHLDLHDIMKIHLDSSGDDVRIEIIPLMDVIFCILTFFILGAVGLSRQQAISQNLPQASTGQTQLAESFRVSIDPIGRIFVNRDAVTFEELPQRLENYLQANPRGSVVIYGHPMAQYDDVLQVMDLLRSIGGDRVSLGVRPSQTEPLERNQQRRSPFEVTPTTPPTSGTRSPIPGLTPSPTEDATPADPTLDETTPDETTPDETTPETEEGTTSETPPEETTSQP
ncbi:ExbD/TolR family protein [Baaleninema sp.]|uniref:ExbD/TolR family protein n=1 Tax=Baaleninema sp. TaxID=3101197 RepID=UPI003D07D0A1